MTQELTLAIETSNPSIEAGVAIGSPGVGALGAEPVRAADGRHDDLITAIDRLTGRIGVSRRDLGRIAVSSGPGGYTTLRIAVATAKMLCETLSAACIAVPTARIVARRARTSTPFAVILASKDNTAFSTVFESPDAQRGEGKLIVSLRDLCVGTVIADQYLPRSMVDEARALGIEVQQPRFDATTCLELSYGCAAVDPVALGPLYPREAEAVTRWRERHGR